MVPHLRYRAATTTVGTLFIFQGYTSSRLHAYENFLLFHIVLSLAFIVGCYVTPYDNYMPCSLRLFRFIGLRSRVVECTLVPCEGMGSDEGSDGAS
ncbi:hypothetical protein BGY98DRAFT_688372 [Russula aff. rugulosa BPL654]|nr:hypothetical protein BGY98DRAFT_688372 [Russula aff. rugulosa BPL654]